eukprot:scaffold353_cov161-Skeletonema_marinoi.AAC.8
MPATKQRNRKNAVHPQNNIAAAAANDLIPAYPGARFNSSGFCINHSNIRLCTVTDEGKYKILRKVCFKCGSSSMRNNYRVTTLHGNAKKVIPVREVQKGMFSATTSSDRGRQSGGGASRRMSMSGDQNSNSTAKKSPSPLEVRQRRKTNESRERSTIKMKDEVGTKKDRISRSTEPTTSPQLRRQLERSTRRSRSRSLSTTSTSRTVASSLSLSPSDLSGLYPPPPGRPTPTGRSRSKSRSRQANSGTSSKTSSSKDDNKKLVRSTPTPINLSSSKSVEAKVKEITNSKKTHGKVDYTKLGKLITMKDDENTLPTLPCPATPESFKSKQAVFSIDKSDLIVELYNKKESELDDTMRISNRREDTLGRMPKLKPRSSTRKAS